jgi:exodeoxyribonuclease V beta subunit
MTTSLFRAVDAPLHGTVLIEASAGTGKTTALCQLYARFVVESGHEVGSILLVTFTRAAVAEVRLRIRERLASLAKLYPLEDDSSLAPDESDALTAELWQRWRNLKASEVGQRLHQALAQFDQAAILTIHGFCQRVLSECPLETQSPLGEVDSGFADTVLDEFARDFYVQKCVNAALPQVRLVRSVKIEELKRIAKSVMAQPAILGLSRRGMSTSEIQDALQVWDRARVDALAAWDEGVEELLIAQKTSLVGAVYKINWLSGWLRRIPILLSDAGPEQCWEGDSPVKAIARLSQRELQQHTIAGQQTPTHPFFGALDAVVEALPLAVEACAAFRLELKLEFVSKAQFMLDARARRSHIRTFDDLLRDLARAINGPQGEGLAQTLRSRFPIALVDEFQDTDALQYDIFSRVWQRRNHKGALYLVGDPKQAIYGFRGADIFAYLRARETIGEARFALVDNYRSSESLIAAVNCVFSRLHFPFALSQIEFLGASAGRPVPGLLHAGHSLAPLRLVGMCPGEGVPSSDTVGLRWICEEIAQMLQSEVRLQGSDEVLTPGDFAVLCEANWQAQACYEFLCAAGVPAILGSNVSVLESREASDILAVLSSILEPRDIRRLRLALLTPIFGFDAGALARVRLADAHSLEESAREEALQMQIEVWVQRFAQARELWLQKGISAAAFQILRQSDCEARLVGQMGGERAYTNLIHVVELLQTVEFERSAGPESLVAWLTQAILRAQDGEAPGEAELLRLETQSNAVSLVTVHKSKGLQYRVVFCAPVGERGAKPLKLSEWPAAHVRTDAGEPMLQVELEGDGSIMSRIEGLSESLRLLYVALTRAQSHTTLVLPAAYYRRAEKWEKSGARKLSALAYALHQPARPSDLEVSDHESWYTAVASRLATCDPVADLEALVAAGRGTIAIEWPVVGEDTSPFLRVTGENELPSIESPRWEIPDWPYARAHSFTSMIRDAPLHADDESTDWNFGRDDAVRGESMMLEVEPEPILEPVTLADFPRGRSVGRLIHRLFEIGDWTRQELNYWVDLMANEAEARQIEPESREKLALAMNEILACRLEIGEDALSLREIAAHDRLAEMRFSFAVGEGELQCTFESIAAILGGDSSDLSVREFARRWRLESARNLRGYLNGAVDLIFRRNGRYFLVDFKSNNLGATFDAYSTSSLWRDMIDDGYVLQYHLYALALHRHLRTRLRDYDYERDFGGVIYLYVRGMHPNVPNRGVLHTRPCKATIVELDRLFGEGSHALPSQRVHYA